MVVVVFVFVMRPVGMMLVRMGMFVVSMLVFVMRVMRIMRMAMCVAVVLVGRHMDVELDA